MNVIVIYLNDCSNLLVITLENRIKFRSLLQALKWDLSPMTTNSWLNVYLQLVNADSIDDKEHNFVFPQYSSHAFIQIARVSQTPNKGK